MLQSLLSPRYRRMLRDADGSKIIGWIVRYSTKLSCSPVLTCARQKATLSSTVLSTVNHTLVYDYLRRSRPVSGHNERAYEHSGLAGSLSRQQDDPSCLPLRLEGRSRLGLTFRLTWDGYRSRALERHLLCISIPCRIVANCGSCRLIPPRLCHTLGTDVAHWRLPLFPSWVTY